MTMISPAQLNALGRSLDVSPDQIRCFQRKQWTVRCDHEWPEILFGIFSAYLGHHGTARATAAQILLQIRGDNDGVCCLYGYLFSSDHWRRRCGNSSLRRVTVCAHAALAQDLWNRAASIIRNTEFSLANPRRTPKRTRPINVSRVPNPSPPS